MKYLLLSIFVVLAAQPLPVVSCDMHDMQEPSQAQSGNAQHGDMHDAAMADMDCCDEATDDPPANCDCMSHCGTYSTALAAFDADIDHTGFGIRSPVYFSDTDEPLNGPPAPPYRPPIT